MFRTRISPRFLTALPRSSSLDRTLASCLCYSIFCCLCLAGAANVANANDDSNIQSTSEDGLVLVEAEAFDSIGGWFVDQQFMDIMGSPFLLAHGMGTPVEDATTQIELPKAGQYRVWVRTRDWVAPWKVAGAPGKFQVLIDGQPLQTTFGTESDPWHWQDGGVIAVDAQTAPQADNQAVTSKNQNQSDGRAAVSVALSLHDLTGFEGRCDAILFATDLNWQPPNEPEKLAELRQQQLGWTIEPKDLGEFDLVVVGGGVAGTSAAITAARLGVKVALIQDRPVLGGNSSSEVRVWPEGHVNQEPYPRVGDVVMEVVPARTADSKNAQSAQVFDDERKLALARAEPNLTLLLERRMNFATVKAGSIGSVTCQHIRTGARERLAGRWFLDSTGDGVLGYLVGAEFQQTDKGHMGASNLWNIKCLCEDEDPLSSELEKACEVATFPRCPWAVDLQDKPFPGRTDGAQRPQSDPSGKPISIGNWFWESGFDRDPINEMERVRDQNFRAVYGAWDVIKNVERRYPAHRLNWVAYIAGKRESRRLIGDVILTASDLRDGKSFEDGCFPCTWGIDTHFPHPKYADGHEGDEFISDYTRGQGFTYKGPYWVPYRCLYSRNIDNLFMAGRDISVTHEALGAVRVMKTTGAMGEIVGMAAAVCKANNCNPREVYQRHFLELQRHMRVGAGKHEIFQAGPGGVFLLSAPTASLRGKTLQLEPAQDCIGYWRTKGEFAEWKIEVEQAGEFELELEYSCPPQDAGGRVTVLVASMKGDNVELPSTIEATGDWQTFATRSIGKLELQPGEQYLSVKNNKSKGPLMKLRAVRLVPTKQ